MKHLKTFFFLLIVLPAAVSESAHEAVLTSLSKSEKQWIEEHQEVTLGFAPYWPPFSFLDHENRFTGIDHDIMHLIEERTGLKILPVMTSSWRNAYQRAIDGEIDILSGISPTNDRIEHFHFTDPYVSFPVAIITTKKRPLLIGMAFADDLTFALPEEYVTTERFQQEYPDVKVYLTENPLESMRLVSIGKADATLENLVSASTIIRSKGLTNLKVSGISQYQFDLHFAVNKSQPELQSIIDKALASISSRERHAILNNWVHVEHDQLIVWDKIGYAILAILAIIFGVIVIVLLWNRFLAAEIRRRQKAESSLAKALKEKDSLLALVAHDLKNPLQVIHMYMDTLEKETHASEIPAKMFYNVRDVTHRMTRLVNQLVQLKALDHNKIQIELTPIPINEIVHKTLELHKLQAKNKDISLVADIAEEPLIAIADSDALMQICDNLVSNAIKFSPKEKKVSVSCYSQEQKIYIRVSDEGPGFTLDDQKKLFGRFSLLSNRPTGGESSSGIGLSIVKELVDRINGQITCESTPGHGATFTVALPAA
ncbi:MAG: transporter substrate-binding domain-containing protein [Verrucomicrobiota bacterium]